MVVLSAFVFADVGHALWKGQAGAACGSFLRWMGTVLLALALAAIEIIPNWIYLGSARVVVESTPMRRIDSALGLRTCDNC